MILLIERGVVVGLVLWDAEAVVYVEEWVDEVDDGVVWEVVYV